MAPRGSCRDANEAVMTNQRRPSSLAPQRHFRRCPGVSSSSSSGASSLSLSASSSNFKPAFSVNPSILRVAVFFVVIFGGGDNSYRAGGLGSLGIGGGIGLVGATSIYVVEVEKPPKAGAEYAAFTCKGKTGGPFPDPDDCTVYHTCMFGRDFKRNCAAG